MTDVRVIANDYLQAMGVPLLRGRLFNEQDAADSKNRVIINDTMATKALAGRGSDRQARQDQLEQPREDEIIGVVGDVRNAGLDTEARATTYWPHARFPYGTMTSGGPDRGGGRRRS